jgi:hypothetical protein
MRVHHNVERSVRMPLCSAASNADMGRSERRTEEQPDREHRGATTGPVAQPQRENDLEEPACRISPASPGPSHLTASGRHAAARHRSTALRAGAPTAALSHAACSALTSVSSASSRAPILPPGAGPRSPSGPSRKATTATATRWAAPAIPPGRTGARRERLALRLPVHRVVGRSRTRRRRRVLRLHPRRRHRRPHLGLPLAIAPGPVVVLPVVAAGLTRASLGGRDALGGRAADARTALGRVWPRGQ